MQIMNLDPNFLNKLLSDLMYDTAMVVIPHIYASFNPYF